MLRVFLTLCAMGIVPMAYAEPVPARGPVIMVDGDTIKVDGVTIRLVGIDTPETFRPRCERELVLGLAAKQRLRELLNGGPVTYEPDLTQHDRYGRVLAHVYVGEVDIGAKLVAEGIALKWEPGKAAKAARLAVWCN